MNFLSSLSSAVLSASSAALHSAQGGVPGVPAYALGDRVTAFDGKAIWTVWHGTKKVRATSSPRPASSSPPLPRLARTTASSSAPPSPWSAHELH